MSQHFKQAQSEAHKTFGQRLWGFMTWAPEGEHGAFFKRHARFRATLGLAMCTYCMYWHPEYSYISAWYHGSDEPIAHRGTPFDPTRVFQQQGPRSKGVVVDSLIGTDAEPSDSPGMGRERDEVGLTQDLNDAAAKEYLGKQRRERGG